MNTKKMTRDFLAAALTTCAVFSGTAQAQTVGKTTYGAAKIDARFAAGIDACYNYYHASTERPRNRKSALDGCVKAVEAGEAAPVENSCPGVSYKPRTDNRRIIADPVFCRREDGTFGVKPKQHRPPARPPR